MRSDRPGRPINPLDRRYFHRDKSHQESHSLEEAGQAVPIAAHPLASPEPPAFVAGAAELAAMIDRLKAAGSFAFDSEFIGERSYEPQLCLVQVATQREVFVVDPLVGLDLGGFWELLASPETEKIVLAGQQDFGWTVLHTLRAPANIMDVQIAAGFVHAEYPLSLARLVQEFVAVPLGKGLTFTHWDRRPLSAVQMRYAADDVRYLPAARDAIGKRLAELGRAAWAREECASALEDVSLYRPAPESLYLRVRERDRLGRRQLAVLRELAIWRDQAARREDMPPRTLVKDRVLVAMSRHPSRKPADLEAIRGLPRPVESKYGSEIVEATARALALPDAELPPPQPSESTALGGRVDEVWAAMGLFCQERSIAPALVASRREVARFCRAATADHPLGEHRLYRGWRKELLAEFWRKTL
jgi:ribonuclease D